MNLEDPAFTFGIALTGGMAAQVIAQHLRVPGIVVLLFVGVLLGPDVANLVRPETLGPGLQMIVAISVAVILFEGGLQLNLYRLRNEALVIRRLVTIGALVTALGGALAGRYVMGWPWQVAIPFGTLVIVTGPTVITPLLRRIRIKKNVQTILEAEGVLIDPIGAIVAVVTLEVALAQELPVAARGLLGIPTRLVTGLGVGVIGGLIMGRLLASERSIPQRFASVTTLALLLAVYAVAEAIIPESGIMAAPIAGMAVGNMPSRPSKELKEFKEQITVLLVGLLFVLLAADVRVEEVTGLGWRGVATAGLLMAVVRPLDVAISTAGSQLTLRERGFLAWLGPRGIVAAAVASLFAQVLTADGIPQGRDLQAMVFLVIATTVIVQGLGGGLVAGLLGVGRPSNRGYLIAGANPLARELARALRTAGHDVVMVDTDAAEVAAARRDGLSVLFGNALDEEMLELGDVASRRGVIGLIGNEGVSLLVAEKALRDFRVGTAYIAVRPDRTAVPMDRLRALGVRMLFGTETDIAYWSREVRAGRSAVHTYESTAEKEVHFSELETTNVLPLLVERKGQAALVMDETRIKTGDRVTLLHQKDMVPAKTLRPLDKGTGIIPATQ